MTNYDALSAGLSSAFSKYASTPDGVRFLKIRTLVDKPSFGSKSFLAFVRKFGIAKDSAKRNEIADLRKVIFDDKSIDGAFLNKLIRQVYSEVSLNVSDEKKKSLQKILQTSDVHWQGWNNIFRDDIRAHIQSRFIRDPSIENSDQLIAKIKNHLNSDVEGYTIISWFNQWTSTIIEQTFMMNEHVVPTIRKIPKVDFFFNEIPFDLKITFLPKKYLSLMKRTRKIDVKQVIAELKSDQTPLIKWLYENQGEMRFGDDNRIFVILINEENPDLSWKLKANFPIIEKRIMEYLNKKKKMQLIDWTFSGKVISGSFKTYSDAILISGT